MSSKIRTILRAMQRDYPKIYDAKLAGKPIPSVSTYKRKYRRYGGALDPLLKAKAKLVNMFQAITAKREKLKRVDYWKMRPNLVTRMPGNWKQLNKEARAKARRNAAKKETA